MIRNLNLFFNNKIDTLFIFLLILYPSINFLITNLSQKNFFSSIYFYSTLFILIIFLIYIFFIANIFSQNLIKKRIVLFTILFWNLQFFFLYFRSLIAESFFDDYISLLIIILLSICISELIIKNFLFRRFTIFFLIISITINLFNNFSIDLFKYKIINSGIVNNKNVTLNKSNSTNKPNVFYIITDSLGSFEVLNKIGINTEEINKHLIDNNYKIATNAKASYTNTHLTLSSIFEVSYIVDGIKKLYRNEGPYFPFFKQGKVPALVSKLNDLGYDFYWLGNNWAPCTNTSEMRCLITKDRTLLYKILNDYSLNTFFSNSLIANLIHRFIHKFKINNEIDGFDTIGLYKNIIKEEFIRLDKGGIFTLIHHMSPHPPMRNKNCKILTDTKEKALMSSLNYKISSNCVFERIIEFNEIVLSKYPNSIIIIQADHGPGIQPDPGLGSLKKLNVKNIYNRINIFNAGYFPNHQCKNQFYDSIGSVETIKLVLNCIGDKKIEINSKSKTFIFISEENPSIYSLETLNLF